MLLDISKYKAYRKTGTQLMRPYEPGEALHGVAVNDEDTPEEGGMVAVNAQNPADQWYVSKEFFDTNYELVK